MDEKAGCWIEAAANSVGCCPEEVVTHGTYMGVIVDNVFEANSGGHALVGCATDIVVMEG